MLSSIVASDIVNVYVTVNVALVIIIIVVIVTVARHLVLELHLFVLE